ncbi:DNA repair protein rad52 [Gnomoniopsis smithogilvyi]|uniref:RAD52 homolog n=1 Tax=Gnomoniopsis smithogilvyi TaxID=1191159 RepID=A0A9W9D1N5_9PEZI|nr:DNA repair protein rad52 [Gnomoniopsis smithogilvyi]
MPAPGDQHATTLTNPFEDVKPRLSEYTATEIATLQSRLEKQLGPEYLSSRSGPSGQKVWYVTAEKCIALANEVFGFNGWSSQIKEIQVDFVDEHPQTLKISLGLSVIVRVTLRDGTFHEDIGYGHIENCTGKAKAFEKAKKEGTTDALKRALRNFGNVLGNCIYDKDYVKKVTKMKIEPNRGWDENGLHRHADFQKKEDIVKIEPGLGHGAGYPSGPPTAGDSFEDLIGEFDEVDFNIVEDDEHPDEVCVPQQNEKPVPQFNNRPNAPNLQPPTRPLSRSHSAGNPPRAPQTPAQAYPPRPGPQNPQNQTASRPQHPLQQQMNQSRPQNGQNPQGLNSSNNGSHQTPPQAQVQNGGPPLDGVGFLSARAVKQIVGQEDVEKAKLPSAPLSTQAFNPNAESPSIRKTPGIDHTKSKPVNRSGQHVAPTESSKIGEASGKNPGPTPITLAAVAGKPGPGVNASGSGFGASGGQQQQQGLLAAQRGNTFNPQLSQTRRIGAPVGSPMGNRGQYRPPTIKRPLPNEGTNGGGPRPALAEVSVNGTVNVVAAGGGGVGGDPKRQKTG